MAEAIKLRWIDINTIPDVLQAVCDVQTAPEPADDIRWKDRARNAIKWEVLARLGITRQRGENPLTAWLWAMSKDNGLPMTFSCDRKLVDAICANKNAARFMWFLY